MIERINLKRCLLEATVQILLCNFDIFLEFINDNTYKPWSHQIVMKRSTLTVIIPSLLAHSTASAVEIYNKNKNEFDFYGKVISAKGFTIPSKEKNSSTSYGQIGFKGKTQLNDQVTGYGQWEYCNRADKVEDKQDNVTRVMLAGIRITGIGSFDYGRNYNVIYDVKSYTGIGASFFGKTLSHNFTNNYITDHSTGFFTYRNKDFFNLIHGLNFAVQYQNKNNCSNLRQVHGDDIGMSLGYDFGKGYGLIGAYDSVNCTVDEPTSFKKDKIKRWAVGAKYNVYNIYLATLYAEAYKKNFLTKIDRTLLSSIDGEMFNVNNKNQNFEVIAQYQFDFGLRPSISYLQSKSEEINGVDRYNLARYITVGITCFINRNFSLYGNYRFNCLNNKTPYRRTTFKNQTIVSVSYQF